jgi:hypothetical protein
MTSLAVSRAAAAIDTAHNTKPLPAHTHVLKLFQYRQPRRDGARNGVALYLQVPDVHKCQGPWGMVQHTLHALSCAGSTDMYPAQGRTTHPTFPAPPSHCCPSVKILNHPTHTPHPDTHHTPHTTHHTPHPDAHHITSHTPHTMAHHTTPHTHMNTPQGPQHQDHSTHMLQAFNFSTDDWEIVGIGAPSPKATRT